MIVSDLGDLSDVLQSTNTLRSMNTPEKKIVQKQPTMAESPMSTATSASQPSVNEMLQQIQRSSSLDMSKEFQLPPKGSFMRNSNVNKRRVASRFENTALPEIIPLFSKQYNSSAYSKGVQSRHMCIAKIRQVHETALAPYVIGKQKPPTTNSQPQNIYAMLVDPSYHGNVGDTMLTLGELYFMARLGFDNDQIIQCHVIQAQRYFHDCGSTLKSVNKTLSQPVAMWNAGGNWGDLWGIQQPRMKSFVDILSTNHRLLGMPQSLFYQNEKTEKGDVKIIRDNIIRGLRGDDSMLNTTAGLETAQSRVIFTWREYESYEKAKELYPFVTNVVVPDIAFQLGPFEPMREPNNPKNVDIVFFLRADKESELTKSGQRSRQHVQEALNKISQTKSNSKNLTFTIVDWGDRRSLFGDKHTLSIVTAIKLLSLGRVVVADRLHATILTYLTGLPVVYIDQITGKLTKTLRVAFDSWPGSDGCHDTETSMVAKAANLSDAAEKAVEFLDKYSL